MQNPLTRWYEAEAKRMEVDRESDRAFDRQMWWATAFAVVVSAASVAAALAVIVFWASPAKGAEPPRAWTEAPPPKVKAACSYCGDSCKCAKGECPSRCPLTYADAVAKVAKGERVYLSVGKRVETVKVCVGGTCRMMPVAAHTDSLSGFPEGVYECYLLNGSPVMQRR